MILGAVERLRRGGILGMNERKARYVMAFNPRAAYPRVDDKVLSKQLARAEGITAPELPHLVCGHGAIRHLLKELKDLEEFVVKPARGSGGSGILLVTGRHSSGFQDSSGQSLSSDALLYHVSEILSGIHSLEGREDKAIIETLVHQHPVFEKVSYRGVRT